MINVTVETDAVVDTANELIAVRRALATRHGDAFRALDKRLEALPLAMLPTPIHPLHADDGSCRLIIQPPQEWTAILVEARRIGALT